MDRVSGVSRVPTLKVSTRPPIALPGPVATVIRWASRRMESA